MQSLVLLPLLVASAFAGDLHLHSFEPLPQYTQEQNTATGEYGYSYSGGPSSKTEFRALDGTTTGAYSYVDAHGILQTVNYIADEFGFRAAGSNIPSEHSVPLDAPDVAAVKAAHLAEHSRQTLDALSHHRRKRGIIVAAPIVESLPLATSHQSRVQIHHGARLVSHIAAPAVIAAPHAGLLYRKKRGFLLPASSAKIYDELAAKPHYAPAPFVARADWPLLASAPLITKAALPLAAPAATVVETRTAALPLAAPATPIVESLPLATSHQSRFQIHKGAKIVEELHQPIYAAAPIATAPVAAPVVHETFGHLNEFRPAAEAVIADSDAIAVDSA